MEFFDWTNIVQTFAEYFTVATVSSAAEYIQVLLRIMYISVGVAGGLYVVCLILGGLGMRTMAKKVGMKHSWLAFLPLANTWYAVKLAGETQLFGQKMKRVGLYAMLSELVYIAINVFALIVTFALYRPEYFAEQTNEAGQLVGIYIETARIPLELRWLVVANNVLRWVNTISYLVLIFFFCTLFFAFFRKYYARSPFLMTFLCAILPLRGIVIFAVRNNTPVDYNAYMRRRMEEYARRQGMPYGGQGYGGQGYDPYGNPAQGAPRQEDPFSDFGGSPDSSDQTSGSGGQNGDGKNDGAKGGSGENNPFPDF